MFDMDSNLHHRVFVYADDYFVTDDTIDIDINSSHTGGQMDVTKMCIHTRRNLKRTNSFDYTKNKRYNDYGTKIMIPQNIQFPANVLQLKEIEKH